VGCEVYLLGRGGVLLCLHLLQSLMFSATIPKVRPVEVSVTPLAVSSVVLR
jgi:hypothetical protein